MSEQPSAFQTARTLEVAKIVYKTLLEDTEKAIEASRLVAQNENGELLAVLLLTMQLGACAARAAQDLQRFGVQAPTG